MADKNVVVNWDSGNNCPADPGTVEVKKDKNVKITWIPGEGVKSVDNVDFKGNEQFFGKLKVGKGYEVKDKNTVAGRFKYDLTATPEDGDAGTLDPFVENDP